MAHPRPVEIDLDNDDACYGLQAWLDTQETNGEPGDGSPEFFEFLEVLGKEFPDSVVPPSDEEEEEDCEPPRAAGPPESGDLHASGSPEDKPMCREPCLRRYDNHKDGEFVCPDQCALEQDTLALMNVLRASS